MSIVLDIWMPILNAVKGLQLVNPNFDYFGKIGTNDDLNNKQDRLLKLID